jgi:hypothetical protein
VEKAFEEWRLLKKNRGRATSTQQANESVFKAKLDDLFDLAHENALAMITITEDREFLLAQKEKGRRGYMSGWDKELYNRENRAAKRQESLMARRQLMEESRQKINAMAILDSSSSSSEEENTDAAGKQDKGDAETTSLPRKRGRQIAITPTLAAALDRSKVSDRKATFVIAETAKSLGVNISALALNRSSIRVQRQQVRVEVTAKLKVEFQPEVPLVIRFRHG